MKMLILLVIAALTSGSLNADPVDWQELSIKQTDSVWASSSLKEILNGKEITYGPEALFDGNSASPWVEGVSGGGTGENILILTRKMVNSLVLTNGFASSPRLFTRNNRIKNMRVAFVAGLTAPGLVSEMDYYLYFTREKLMPDSFLLEDMPEPQIISLAFSEGVQSDFYRGVIRELCCRLSGLLCNDSAGSGNSSRRGRKSDVSETYYGNVRLFRHSYKHRGDL